MQRLFRRTELFSQLYKSVGIVVIAVHVAQQTGKRAERILIEAAMFFQAVLGACLELMPSGRLRLVRSFLQMAAEFIAHR
jgi:uncharacterized membrane protein YhhN